MLRGYTMLELYSFRYVFVKLLIEFWYSFYWKCLDYSDRCTYKWKVLIVKQWFSTLPVDDDIVDEIWRKLNLVGFQNFCIFFSGTLFKEVWCSIGYLGLAYTRIIFEYEIRRHCLVSIFGSIRPRYSLMFFVVFIKAPPEWVINFQRRECHVWQSRVTCHERSW